MAKTIKTIEIDELTVNVKPLNFAVLKEIQPELGLLVNLANATGVPDLQTLTAVSGTVFNCLRRANPGLTQAQVDENLTIENVGLTIEAIFTISGVKTTGEPTAVS